MKKLLYITFTFCLLASSLKAQQLPHTNLYNVNKFQTNSAYAGFNNCLESYLSHSSQWVGMAGSPTIQYLSTHSGIGKNMALGANLVYDKTDIISKFSGALSYAYHVKLRKDQHLRFGISAGIYEVNINPSNAVVEDLSDDIISSGIQTRRAFSNDLSIYYNYNKLEIGVAVPQIFGTNASFNRASDNGSLGLKRYIVSTISYDVDLPEKFSFQPSLMFNSKNGNQNQVDINGQITYNKLISLGAGYRTHAGLLVRLGFKIKDLFTVSYAYEVSGRDIGLVSNGSHEILLGIKFCKDKSKKNVPHTSVFEPLPKVPEKVMEETKIDTIINHTKEEKVIDEEKNKVVVNEKKEEIIKSVLDLKVQFPLNTDSLDNSFNIFLDRVVEIMLNNPDIKLDIIGHSCDLGSAQVKENISIKRAEVVKEYLVEKGVEAARMSAFGMSDSQPIIPNTSEDNRQKNRRVEFLLK